MTLYQYFIELCNPSILTCWARIKYWNHWRAETRSFAFHMKTFLDWNTEDVRNIAN